MVPWQKRLELATEEHVDPRQKDRRHGAESNRLDNGVVASDCVEDAFERGLDLMRRREFFAAHEELELAWRAADTAERDFYQGLVHVTVAWYQAGRGNRPGCERQLAKAARRLAAFRPTHRGVDVDDVLQQVAHAAETVAGGSLDLQPPRV